MLPAFTIRRKEALMTKCLLAFALFVLIIPAARAQGAVKSTQVLIAVDSKNLVTLAPADVILKVANRNVTLANLIPLSDNETQVALLIDEGVRTSITHEFNNLRDFVNSLPQGTEVFVGYMQSGHVVPAGNLAGFTTNHAAAAQSIRITGGIAEASAGPYVCISDFVDSWPPAANSAVAPQQQQPTHKARFVLMITNGADNINSNPSPVPQDSPSVDSAIYHAQRAGVSVYSIYFNDEGVSANDANFSGQIYLEKLARSTGGASFYHGSGQPASLAPFLDQFKTALAQTYIATFPVDVNKKMVNLTLSTKLPKTKLRGPEEVRPGTVLLSQ
jgi:hypothetical protein